MENNEQNENIKKIKTGKNENFNKMKMRKKMKIIVTRSNNWEKSE